MGLPTVVGIQNTRAEDSRRDERAAAQQREQRLYAGCGAFWQLGQ